MISWFVVIAECVKFAEPTKAPDEPKIKSLGWNDLSEKNRASIFEIFRSDSRAFGEVGNPSLTTILTLQPCLLKFSKMLVSVRKATAILILFAFAIKAFTAFCMKSLREFLLL
jgi:hypothetical protein